jgi:CelD/BcsL family acetyltransferase involved in cellulose biosynthesis
MIFGSPTDTNGVPWNVDVISDLAGLDALRPEWDKLFATSPAAAPPLRWEWVRTWWEVYGPHYGNRASGLRILLIRRGPKLIGILPLYLGWKGKGLFALRRLGFISTGAAEFEETCAEYLNLLHAPTEEASCVEALRPMLCRPEKLGWDELALSELPTGSALLGLASAFTGRFLRTQTAKPGVCHLFSMAGGFEAYLGRLTHENKRQARKMLRDVESDGLEFEVADDRQQLHLFFDQMIELHRERWNALGKPGSFAPRHAEFHRKTSELLLARGEAVIGRLAHSDRPVGIVFGYRVRDRLDCYQQGFTPWKGRVRSPGTAAWLLLMRHQAERGVTLFDHLQGNSTFKERFATGQTTVEEFRVVRLGPRTVSTAVADWMCRGARRIIRLFQKSRKGSDRPVLSESPGHIEPASAEQTVRGDGELSGDRCKRKSSSRGSHV